MSIITILLTTVFSQNSAGRDALQEMVNQGGEVAQDETKVDNNLFPSFSPQILSFDSWILFTLIY